VNVSINVKQKSILQIKSIQQPLKSILTPTKVKANTLNCYDILKCLLGSRFLFIWKKRCIIDLTNLLCEIELHPNTILFFYIQIQIQFG